MGFRLKFSLKPIQWLVSENGVYPAPRPGVEKWWKMRIHWNWGIPIIGYPGFKDIHETWVRWVWTDVVFGLRIYIAALNLAEDSRQHIGRNLGFLTMKSGRCAIALKATCRTLLLDTLLGQSCGTLFCDTLVLWHTLVGHSCETLLPDTLARHSCGTVW